MRFPAFLARQKYRFDIGQGFLAIVNFAFVVIAASEDHFADSCASKGPGSDPRPISCSHGVVPRTCSRQDAVHAGLPRRTKSP